MTRCISLYYSIIIIQDKRKRQKMEEIQKMIDSLEGDGHKDIQDKWDDLSSRIWENESRSTLFEKATSIASSKNFGIWLSPCEESTINCIVSISSGGSVLKSLTYLL